MRTQREKGQAFVDLHQRDQLFLIPNPWDVGTAHALELLGYEALASTSAGYSFSKGRPDNDLDRDEVLRHLEQLSAATTLPINADFENCFADNPKGVFENIRLAAQTGVVGASIEDSRNDGSGALFDAGVAVERVRAAAESAHGLDFPFLLTARCEEMLRPSRDLSETIDRLQQYQEAGADVLYAPGLRSLSEIESVMRAVDRPVNVLVGAHVPEITVDALARLGVRRVSVGGALARSAWAAFLEAAREMKESGTFSFAAKAITQKAMHEFLGKS